MKRRAHSSCAKGSADVATNACHAGYRLVHTQGHEARRVAQAPGTDVQYLTFNRAIHI